MLKCLTPKDIKSPNGSLLLYGHENEIEIKASVQKLWAKQKKYFILTISIIFWSVRKFVLMPPEVYTPDMRKVEIQTDFWGLEISLKADDLWTFPQKYAWDLSTQKVSGKFPHFWSILWKFASKIQL